MIFFILISAILAVSLSAPLEDQIVSVTQSSLGDYKLSIKTSDLSRNEERDINGDIVGVYSYPDANGQLHTVEYTAGKNGFVILRGLPEFHPVPVQETPEVLAERQRHLELISRGGKSLEVVPEVTTGVPVVVPSHELVLPNLRAVENNSGVVVEDPEVVAAKLAHFEAHREARARLGLP